MDSYSTNYVGNKQKDVKNILLISKKEATTLNEEYGVRYGENGISHTYTKSRKYYLCENKYNLNALEKIRKNQTVG